MVGEGGREAKVGRGVTKQSLLGRSVNSRFLCGSCKDPEARKIRGLEKLIFKVICP